MSPSSARSPSPTKKRSLFLFCRRLLLRLIFLAAFLAVCWYFVLPRIRPPLHEGERYGIDVSHHQGEIDWEAVAGDNITFVYIKATEGEDFTDPQFGRNWRLAGAAGLDRGSYHFFTACTSGATQAQNFLRVAPPQAGVLPPAVDLELAGNCINHPSASVVANELDVFLRLIEEAWTQPPLVYMSDEWDELFPTSDRLHHQIWQLNYPFRPSEEWLIWQLPPYITVDGIDGRVDLDVMAPEN